MSLEIVFLTSSRTKLAHIRYWCEDYNINITTQKNYGIAYEEPRITDREQLLTDSYASALERWKKTISDEEKIFILEDTSVKIEALSSETMEVPGVDIKYWMKEQTFSTLDTLLKSHGNNRKCSVRSDIIMHLPKSWISTDGRPFLQFTSIVTGQITDQEYEFSTNALYPWLDNKTFNKWFVPDGSLFPLGMLTIDEANNYDFRKQAIINLLQQLKDKKFIRLKSQTDKRKQKILNFSPLFILCGPTCAGKSTLASYLTYKYNYFHIEASDFMWLKFHEIHGTNPEISIGQFAKKMLEKNPEIVTEQIIDYLEDINDQPIVISGFRNPHEVDHIYQYSSYYTIELLYIDAPLSIRYNREINRQRHDMVPDYQKFLDKDNLQHDLGLNIIREKVEMTTPNESSIDEFFQNFDEKYASLLDQNVKSFEKFEKFETLTLEKAILVALWHHKDERFTTTEIANIIDTEILIETYENRKNNVSRYFNFAFYPYYDITTEEHKNYYQINLTGISMAKRILWQRELDNQKNQIQSTQPTHKTESKTLFEYYDRT